jgi:hypothetical protein
MIKKLKNGFKPSVRKQMVKTVSKDPSIEHAFVKLPRRKISNISKNGTKDSVCLNSEKIKKYLRKHKVDRKRLSHIHTHIYEKGTMDLPSFIDIVAAMNKGYNHIVVFSGKKEVGRITYNFNPNSETKKKINSTLEIRNKIILDLKRAKEILTPEKYDKLLIAYNNFFYSEIEINFKAKMSNWQKKNPQKTILDFYKEIGLSIKFIPNKKEGYIYDYEKLEFVKK